MTLLDTIVSTAVLIDFNQLEEIFFGKATEMVFANFFGIECLPLGWHSSSSLLRYFHDCHQNIFAHAICRCLNRDYLTSLLFEGGYALIDEQMFPPKQHQRAYYAYLVSILFAELGELLELQLFFIYYGICQQPHSLWSIQQVTPMSVLLEEGQRQLLQQPEATSRFPVVSQSVRDWWLNPRYQGKYLQWVDLFQGLLQQTHDSVYSRLGSHLLRRACHEYPYNSLVKAYYALDLSFSREVNQPPHWAKNPTSVCEYTLHCSLVLKPKTHPKL